MSEPLNFTIKQIRNTYGPAMRAVGIQAARSIRKRVDSDGTDADGAQMGKYSPAYARYKRRRNRRADRVTLRDTSQMMNDLKPVDLSSDGRSVTLGFSLAESRKKARYTNKRYDWLGLTKKQQREAVKIISKHLGPSLAKKRTIIIK